MAKVQKIFKSPLQLNFLNPSESREVYYQSFLRSNLGKIYQSIPWAEMVKALDLSSSKVGRKSYFSPQGQLAL
ncbi:MAG: transposase, partial [Bacteroidota bacterium]